MANLDELFGVRRDAELINVLCHAGMEGTEHDIDELASHIVGADRQLVEMLLAWRRAVQAGPELGRRRSNGGGAGHPGRGDD